MTTPTIPSAKDLLAKMRASMGRVPAAIEKSTIVDDGLIQEHMRSRMYAMPEGGALDEQTRTLDLPSRSAGGFQPGLCACDGRQGGAARHSGGQSAGNRAYRPLCNGHQDHRRCRAGVRCPDRRARVKLMGVAGTRCERRTIRRGPSNLAAVCLMDIPRGLCPDEDAIADLPGRPWPRARLCIVGMAAAIFPARRRMA